VFGRMPPCSFIPILEEYHLIHILDKYIMETACKDVRDQFKKNSCVIPVSINLSRLDFELMNPAAELERCIKKYDIARKDVHIEITETALSSNDDKLKKILEAFRNNGNSLWLDDFGSGYSGLNVLKDFTFDLMKIDMVFLSKFDDNEKSQPILKSIVNLAQKIGMQILTEGVETQAACDFLSEIGCQRLQGYLFGKPMPVEELISKIKDGTYEIDV
jgi:EAL domain-containing protein (putative c-di-GMP-specific phosphodiesterase class I)